jgi:signal transduction histidine kinase
LFFAVSIIVTFLMLGFYVVYNYNKELSTNLKNSLTVMAEDVVRHELYKNDPEKIKASFHLLEEYHETPFVALFDRLTFSIQDQKPVNEKVCSVVKKLPDDRYLVVSSGRDAVQNKLLAFIVKLLLVFGPVLLLFILVFVYFLNRLFLPLRCLVRFCKESSSENGSMPLCNGSSEVNDLKEAIIGLLESNHTLCKQKQDIFKEAAHEIKSPIAILKARLALFKQNDKYEKVTFVQESEDDIKTISNKLRELLFLKEIEWDMKKQKETISMQEQCSMMQQAFKPILEKKGLTMVSNWEEDFTLSVHKEAMQKVMQAVFENIFMHTKNNSTITNYVDTAHRRLYIVNEMGDKSDETLFSSFIGSKLIERLADKLDYTYDLEEREGKFYTTIVFNLSEQKCEI